MHKPLIITSYENPDLDGTACAMGYAELLTKQGKDAQAAIFGVLHKETRFVMKTFAIMPPQNGKRKFTNDALVVLVDASDTIGISPCINPSQVIEIIDHRRLTEVDKFHHAKVQIELVGSAATLIAEKFFSSGIPVSSTSAALLYSAIISNTINFQANVTTKRDRGMAAWLKNYFNEPKDYIHDMFADKSTFDAPLHDIIDHDFAQFQFGGKRIGIAQIEIISVQEYIELHLLEIQSVLSTIEQKKRLDYIFLTAIDVEKATNTFVVIDQKTMTLLTDTFHVSFENNIAHRKGIMMRKTITPFLKEVMENTGNVVS